MRIATWLAAPLLLFLLGGCGSDNLAPVSGTITMNGKPLANANVNFQPIGSDNKEVGPGSYGKTDADGHYSLRLKSTERPGAVVGKYKVSITMGVDSQSDANGQKDPIPGRFNANTKLECDVPAGGTDKADFSLDSKPDPPTTRKVERDT
jgi:hypothetical protein